MSKTAVLGLLSEQNSVKGKTFILATLLESIKKNIILLLQYLAEFLHCLVINRYIIAREETKLIRLKSAKTD